MDADFNAIKLQVDNSAQSFIQWHAGKTISRGGYKHSVSPCCDRPYPLFAFSSVAYRARQRRGNTGCWGLRYSITLARQVARLYNQLHGKRSQIAAQVI